MDTTTMHLLCPHCGWTGTEDELDVHAPWGAACPRCSKPVDDEGEARRAEAIRNLHALRGRTESESEDESGRGGRHPRAALPHWRSKRDRIGE